MVISGASAGTAVLKTASFAAGPHSVKALYTGAPQSSQSTGSSSSSPVAITVTGLAPTSTSLTIFPSVTQPGTYDLTATLLAASSVTGQGTLDLNELTTGTSLASESVDTTGGFLPAQTFFQDTEFSAAAAGDFNGDGVTDLAFIDLTNLGNGAFQTNLLIQFGDPNHPGQFLPPVSYLLSAFANWIAVGDVNGDGLPDVVVGSHDTDIGLFLNNASNPGQFNAEQVLGNVPNSGTVGLLADLNGDGMLDLAVPSGSDVAVFFGDPANPGQFLAPQNLNLTGIGVSPYGLEIAGLQIADFNQDGVPDLAVSTPENYEYSADTAISIFLGDPAHPGQFTAAGTYPAPGTGDELLGDFNGDGLPDILAGSVLLLNDAAHPGNFQSVATSFFNNDSYENSFVVDVNGDGIPDLIGLTAPRLSCSNCDTLPALATILLSDPAHPGQFPNQGSNYSLGLNNFGGPLPSAVGDFNGDGQPDFAVASASGVAVMIGAQIATLTAPNTLVPGSGISSVGAAYSGDTHYQPSSSNAIAIDTSALLTTTKLTASATEITQGSQVVLTAAVQANQGTPSGPVAFYDGNSVVCTGTLDAFGQATCAANPAEIGAHIISATYSRTGPYASSTSSSTTIAVAGEIAGNSLTASPNPIPVTPGTLTGVTTIQWSAPSASTVELHLGSPNGPLFAGGGSTGSATTGLWVTDGMLFYLQDTTAGAPLTPANTLGVLILHVQQQPVLSASPNPIPVPPGSALGATTISWNVPLAGEWFVASSLSIEVHIGSPSGPLFAAGGNTGAATTGDWVTDGMVFYLQDVTGGKPLTPANTVSSIVVHLEQQPAVFTADPNPIPAETLGATTLHWNARLRVPLKFTSAARADRCLRAARTAGPRQPAIGFPTA
ncbi:MAG TPA: FG-GAP-like repeat-containing protein [Bryobacteraceae bacterium]|nr:FG-GAP-like repeat-containing protein [Bryobacteraceae bacterium]